MVCDKGKLGEKGCTGAPDIIIEIISPKVAGTSRKLVSDQSSSASRDQIVKRKLYEKHAVKEFWIVHPIDRLVWKYILINSQYGKPEIYDYKNKPSFNLFPDLKIDLYKAFGVKKEDYIREPSPKDYRV